MELEVKIIKNTITEKIKPPMIIRSEDRSRKTEILLEMVSKMTIEKKENNYQPVNNGLYLLNGA